MFSLEEKYLINKNGDGLLFLLVVIVLYVLLYDLYFTQEDTQAPA